MNAPLVWVTGAAGMLGRALVASLHARGVAVLATGHAVDIADRRRLREALADHRPTCIFNAAAYTAVDDAEQHPAAAFAANADGAANVAELARELGADLVHFSTDYVFDGTGPEPLRADAVTAPQSVYGQSKLAGEARALATVDAHHRVVVLRTSWLFGADPKSFVSRMLALMAAQDELHVVTDQHGRPTAVADLAQVALELGLGRLRGLPSGIYHFANGGPTSWHGFATAIRDAALRHGLPLKTCVIHPVTSSARPRPAPRPSWSVLDCTPLEHALAALGTPVRPWLAALDELVAERAHLPDGQPIQRASTS